MASTRGGVVKSHGAITPGLLGLDRKVPFSIGVGNSGEELTPSALGIT
jgi:hypothetical protein